MICPHPSCPLELTRKAINEIREREGANGNGTMNETIMSCKLCAKTRGWKRKDGQDYPIEERNAG